jgi:branched-chain amino acid transport system substrate-binding protein
VQGKAAAEFLWRHLKLKKAATICDASLYSEVQQTTFAETFESLGGSLILQQTIAPTETNMSPVLSKIAATDAEAIYFPVFVTAGSRIARQVREIPSLQKVVLISADATFTPDFYKNAGDAAVGVYHSSPDFSSFGIPYVEFLKKYTRRYGERPIAPFHAYAYDAAMMIFGAIEKVTKKGEDGTLSIGRRELRDTLYATKDFRGLTGNLTCTPTGDCGDPKIAIFKTTDKNVKDLIMPDRIFWKSY